MSKMQFLLMFLALYVGMAHSWDIALSSGDDTLNFYTNEILTSTISIQSRHLTVLAYDEVHNMMVYVDKQTNNDIICGYDLTSAENKCFTEGSGRNIHGLAFDPVTERVYFTDTNERSINWISLKPGFNNNINGHLFIKMDDGIPRDIAIDSCKRYVYWLTTDHAQGSSTIDRARLDGTERELFEWLNTISINSNRFEPNTLAIDQQTQAIYFMNIEMNADSVLKYNLYSRALNNEFKKSIMVYGPITESQQCNHPSNTLTVSKNSFIFRGFCNAVTSVYELLSKTIIDTTTLKQKSVYEGKRPVSIVAKYKIKDQIQGIQDCEALSQVEVASENDRPFCVHGMKVIGQSACKCTPGYTGERCDMSVCENYCFQGSCTFNDEGIPECRCNAGYSGDRCHISICDNNFCSQGNCRVNDEGLAECRCNAGYTGERCHMSVCDNNFCSQGNCSVNDEGLAECRCNAGYSGERCHMSVCDNNFCSQGNCSVNDEGRAECRCNAGYSGERCHISVCENNYCSQGNCSVNDEGLAECRCNAGYSGERCHISVCDNNYCLQGNCRVNDEGLAECRCNAGYSGERCHISVCDNNYCLQGNCSVNDEGLAECRCNAGYSGERCHISVCDNNYCLQGNCSVNDEGLAVCSCDAGVTGQRCEVNECQGYCLNGGECSLNEEDEPFCQCGAGYEGTRCEAEGSSGGLSETISILANFPDKSSTCTCLPSNQPFKSIKS